MNNLKLLLICSLFLGIASISLAQEKIHWANQVEYQYNQFSAEAGSAQNVIGEPSAFPYGQPSSNTYRLAVKNGFGRLIVSFEKAVNAKQILIVENYLPGRINKVIAYDLSGGKHLVYDGGYKIEADYRVMRIPLTSMNIEINKIEISILAYYEEGHPDFLILTPKIK
jgi:archaellum component FlaG (FlaF/FlaG flagellin family)